MSTDTQANLPTLKDVLKAQTVLDGIARRTPLLECPLLNDRLSARVLVKSECLQWNGAFKIRGAYNFIHTLMQEDEACLRRGVVAFSSGNHAQAVADVARRHAIPAVIVMPSDAPQLKLRRTEALGAEVVLYERAEGDRELIARNIAEERQMTLVPPYDHPLIIAGQGTVGLEIVEQTQAIGVVPDFVLIPCSGGGLMAGCVLAISDKLPNTRIYAVEPAGYDDTRLSLQARRPVSVDPPSPTCCDGLAVKKPGSITFAINQQHVSGGLVVTDSAAQHAIRLAFEHFRIVLEPSGAVALAATAAGKLFHQERLVSPGPALPDFTEKTLVVVASGGNVDPLDFAQYISRP